MKQETTSENDTQNLANEFAGNLSPRDFVALRGELGAGKSVFARALIRKLTKNPHLFVPSPTFTLLQTYDTPKSQIYHFDLYRLERPEDVFELGFEDAIAGGISIVEWPSKAQVYLPQTRWEVEINFGRDENSRLISMVRVA